MILHGKRASTTILLLILVAMLVVPVSDLRACGWWGDGEDDDADAIIVLPEGKSDADLVMDEARTLLKTSVDPERLTRMADRLLKLHARPDSGPMALKVLTRAARLGFAPAQNNLGVLYEQGRIVPRDDRQAAAWFERAARQGDARARHSLAMMYAGGRGVTRDMTKARELLERSARQGHAGACTDLKKLFGVPSCPAGTPGG